MLTVWSILRSILELLGFVGREVHDAEQQQIGRQDQQGAQDKADLDAIKKANKAAADALDKFRADGVPSDTSKTGP